MLTPALTAQKNREMTQLRTHSLPMAISDDKKWKALGEFAHRFSVSEYALLAEAGILRESDY